MIDPEVAIEIARKRSVEKDWEFAEPVEVVPYHRWFGGLDRFEIETNAAGLGTKAYFMIDAETGDILSEDYRVLPR